MEILSVLHQIGGELKALNARPRPAIMYYLGESLPYALATMPDGVVFKVLPDGSTHMSIAGVFVPVPGCPCPEAIWRLNVGVFAWRHRKQIPLALACLLGLASLQFLLSTVPGAPGAAWFADWFSAVMNAALVSLGAVALVAVAIWNFRRGLTVRLGQADADVQLLFAGQTDISPDILVMSETDNEPPVHFAERIEAAQLEQMSAGQYVLIFAFRHPFGTLVRRPNDRNTLGGSSQVLFRRDALTDARLGLPLWSQEVCSPRIFEHETWAEFQAYVRYFCEQYRGWAVGDKQQQTGNPAADLVAHLKAAAGKAAACAALFFMPLFLGAQSAVPVPPRAGWTGQNSVFNKLPDSASLEVRKAAFMLERAAEWKRVEPVVDYYMWRFEISFLVIFIGIGGILWVFAKVAARDSIKDIYGAPIFGDVLTRMHIWSKGCLFLILAAVTLVYLGEAVVRYYYTGEMPTFWTLVKWAVICWFWYKVFEFVLPDTPGSKPEHQSRQLGGGGYPRIN